MINTIRNQMIEIELVSLRARKEWAMKAGIPTDILSEWRLVDAQIKALEKYRSSLPENQAEQYDGK